MRLLPNSSNIVNANAARAVDGFLLYMMFATRKTDANDNAVFC